MIKLHDYILSGDCYKVRLMLSMLGLQYEPIKVDVHPGKEHLRPAFLAINPQGTIPVLSEGEFSSGTAEAILTYLALSHDRSRRWLPKDAALAGHVSRWLAFATHELSAPSKLRLAAIQSKHVADRDALLRISERSLAILEDHLFVQASKGLQWIVGDHATVADVAVFAPVALAPDAGISLDPYRNIWRWINAFKHLPGFKVMPGVLPPDLADALPPLSSLTSLTPLTPLTPSNAATPVTIPPVAAIG